MLWFDLVYLSEYQSLIDDKMPRFDLFINIILSLQLYFIFKYSLWYQSFLSNTKKSAYIYKI